MSVLLTCGRCRQWEQEIDAPPDVPFICPVCGGLVPDGAAPGPISETATLPPTGPVAAPGADAALLAGRDWPAVAGYEILGELGRGGMGVVYQARQIGLDRLVALKMILSGDHAGEAERTRFKIEAEAAARLRHPNIVQVFEVGESAGRPFFSLEFVDGGSLAGKLGGTPWRPRPSAGLIMTLARAVHAAHGAGIVHRDLKPANVLLTAEGQPKITDFGLAKKLGDAAGLTQSGAVVGTPSYMAPEQAGGQARQNRPGDRHVRAGGDPLRVPDRKAAVPGGDAAGHGAAGHQRRAGPAAAAAIENPARCRDDLSEMSAERAEEALRERRGAGGRPGAVPRRQADRGAAGGPAASAAGAGVGATRGWPG